MDRIRPFILIALVFIAAQAEDAPRIRETDPYTGTSTIRSMRPLDKLPKRTAEEVVSLSDSLYSALGGAIERADKIRMAQELPEAILRGRSFRGASFSPNGKVAIAIDSGAAKDRDLTGTMAWAIWFVRTYGDQRIQFSLDPVDPRNFAKGNDAMYLPREALAPFAIGRELYEADMDLKLYALGYERDGAVRFKDLSWQPPGYRSRMKIASDLFAKDSLREGSVKARLWIVCDSIFATVTDSAMRIDSVRIKVHARRMGLTSDNKLEDIAEADPVTHAFATWFETRYNDLVPRHPELAAVVENAKALAIARWMVSKSVGPDERWAEALLPVVDSTVVHGPALLRHDTLKDMAKRQFMVLDLTGGVELGGVLAATGFVPSNIDKFRHGHRKPDQASLAGSSLFARPEGSLSNGKVAIQPLADDWLKKVRHRKSNEDEWEIAANGLPVASVDRYGKRISYTTSLRKVVAASVIGTNRRATLTHNPDGTSRLDSQDQEHLLVADYDAHGTLAALWEYPSHREVPAPR